MTPETTHEKGQTASLALGTGSASWVKNPPMPPGFYWYRETPTSEPEVVIHQLRGAEPRKDIGLSYIWRFAPKPTLGGMFYGNIEGEFWSEQILPPNT